MGFIVKFFVQNYKLTIAISMFLMIFGFQGLKSMNAEKFPAVSMATATITTGYRGASAEDIENKITKPIEDEIKRVVGIKDISSVSMSGLSKITIRVDMDNYVVSEVMDEIQKKIDGTPGLPVDLESDPVFFEINSAEMPVLEIALLGDNSRRQRDLSAEDLQEEIEDIEQVKKVTLSGYGEREFSILLDAEKMKGMYVSVSEVISKVRGRNVNIPGGKLRSNSEESLIRVEGKIESAKELENFMIRSNFDGKKVLLSDIATVVDGEEEKNILARFNGEPATVLTVIKKAGQDTIGMVNSVKEKIDEFKKQNEHQEIRFETIMDESIEVSNKIEVLGSNAITGLLLVIIFLFIFLPGKIASAASLSLPLAVMATFGIMPFFDLNLDSVTVLALIIAIGMLVDNSVVISETYSRNLTKGMDPQSAVTSAVKELWGPITASALTTIAAFLPMMVTKGIMGAFISSIPIVVTTALIISLAESFFLLPMRLTKMVSKGSSTPKKEKAGFFKKFEGVFFKFMQACIKKRYIVFIMFIAVLGTSFFFLTKMNKFILTPAEQTEVYFARIEASGGSTVENTDLLAKRLADDIRGQLKEYVSVVSSLAGESRSSLDDPKAGDGANLSLLKIYVNNKTKLSIPHTEVLSKLRAIDTSYLSKVSYEEKIEGPPVGSPIQAKFRSNKKEPMDKMIGLVMKDLSEVDGVLDLKIDDVVGEDEIEILIDFEAADRVGLSAEIIGASIRSGIAGAIVSEVTIQNKEVDLKVQFLDKYKSNIDNLKELKVLNGRGKLVSLGKIAKFKKKKGSPQIKRYNNKRSKTIVGSVDVEKITSEKVNAIVQASYEKHRENIKGVSLNLIGEAESSAESVESLASAMNIALLCIFGLLIFMFNSFLKPFIILTTIPLGLLGFSVSFWAHDRPVSFLALIGVIGLAGIVVNAGIVLISYIDDLRKENNEDLNQVLAMAAVVRFRPVLITSLTTISGLFPTAYGIGGSDPTLIPMTLAMAWGLTTGTVLTLVWVPCAYGILEDISGAASSILSKIKFMKVGKLEE